jgi:hypothetical protein
MNGNETMKIVKHRARRDHGEEPENSRLLFPVIFVVEESESGL